MSHLCGVVETAAPESESHAATLQLPRAAQSQAQVTALLCELDETSVALAASCPGDWRVDLSCQPSKPP
jgi:hypothetical protein